MTGRLAETWQVPADDIEFEDGTFKTKDGAKIRHLQGDCPGRSSAAARD